MKPPDVLDRVVKVTAYLTDTTFGYEHWRAAQFSVPDADVRRPGVLLIFETAAERDVALQAALRETEAP